MILKFNTEKLRLLNAFFHFHRPLCLIDHAFHRTDEETASASTIVIYYRMGVNSCQIGAKSAVICGGVRTIPRLLSLLAYLRNSTYKLPSTSRYLWF